MAFNVTVIDRVGSYASYMSQIRDATLAAAAIWQQFIPNRGSIEIQVSIEPVPSTRADGHSVVALAIGSIGGRPLVQDGAIIELMGGSDPNGNSPDIEIRIGPSYLTNELFFDATPASSNDLPNNRIDAITMLMHEIGHAIGFNGFLSSDPSMPVSTYDQYVQVSNGVSYFVGPHARAVYGAPVPLTTGNATHYGNADGPGSDLIQYKIMNGVVTYYGRRYEISELDLAIVRDAGLTTTWYYPGTSNNDQIRVTLAGGVDGGSGLDTAVYGFSRSNYSVLRSSTSTTVTSVDGDQNILTGIERLQFINEIVALDVVGNAGDAYRIYQAAFDRTPDRPGLSYWVNQMDDGMPLSQVALNFILSPEFAATYGNINSMSNAQFVNVVYDNVLHRAPDTGGFNYWMNDLANGYPRHYMLAAFSQSAENQANVAAAIQNGILLDLGAFV